MGETAILIPIFLFLGIVIWTTIAGGIAINSVPKGR